MTQEQETVIMIRGTISQMSDEDQLVIKNCVDEIQILRARCGHLADMAIALIGAELAVIE